MLDEFRGLGGDAAAAAIAAGQPERALELLEAARAVIWSQQLDTRTDLSTLRDVAPALADELDQARAALDHGSADQLAAGRGWDPDELLAALAPARDTGIVPLSTATPSIARVYDLLLGGYFLFTQTSRTG
jgi:hypothetical protein